MPFSPCAYNNDNIMKATRSLLRAHAAPKQAETLITVPTVSPEEEIRATHAELNKYIAELETKVHQVVQQHEAEILLAYRNHCAKIKEELQEFKAETLEKAKNENDQIHRIDCLEKQLIVFRSEALRLFQLLLQKDQRIAQLQLWGDQLDSEVRYLRETVKELTEANKRYAAQLRPTESVTLDLNSFTSVGIASFQLYKQRESQVRNRTQPTTQHSKTASQPLGRPRNRTVTLENSPAPSDCSPQLFERQLKAKLAFLETDSTKEAIRVATDLFTDFSRKKQTPTPCDNSRQRVHLSKSRLARNKSRTEGMSVAKRQEMLQYFCKCVELVRREVGRRRQSGSANFFKEGSAIGLEEFKRVDFFRLLELVFAHERILRGIYRCIFEADE